MIAALDDGVVEARPNPYRWLSALLILVIAGLGVAVWQLLGASGDRGDRPDPGVAVAGPDPQVTTPGPSADPAPVPAKDPAVDAPTSAGVDVVTDPRFGQLQAISDDERLQVSRDLQEIVKKCAKSHGIRREDQGKVRVGLRVEAVTGKISGDLPSAIYDTLFGTCIIEALRTVQFAPGRKYMRYELDFAP